MFSTRSTRALATALAFLSLSALTFAAPLQATEKGEKPAPTKKAEAKKADSKKKATAEKPVSLNKATATELQTLPGIGAATAERILAFRKEKGKFTEIAQLMEVKGIGEKKLAKLKPLVTLD